jgi:tRNA-splicing ligase RtcB
MRGAANYAWANRQCIMHWTREAFQSVLSASPASLGMSLVYDVAHNIAKVETHEVDGAKRKLMVHRKGATRAFPPHGAGRVLSRHQAIKRAKGRAIWRELEDRGIIVMSKGRRTLAEEMSEAYKDISEVVEVVHQAGISRKVARLRPMGVVKG